MAKHTGVTIRIGAAYDTVQIDMQGQNPLLFDRAELSKQRVEGTYEERKAAKEALYQLRKQMVDAFVTVQSLKNKRRQRIARKQRDRQHAA